MAAVAFSPILTGVDEVADRRLEKIREPHLP
jgi:hypothetical protein